MWCRAAFGRVAPDAIPAVNTLDIRRVDALDAHVALERPSLEAQHGGVGELEDARRSPLGERLEDSWRGPRATRCPALEGKVPGSRALRPTQRRSARVLPRPGLGPRRRLGRRRPARRIRRARPWPAAGLLRPPRLRRAALSRRGVVRRVPLVAARLRVRLGLRRATRWTWRGGRSACAGVVFFWTCRRREAAALAG